MGVAFDGPAGSFALILIDGLLSGIADPGARTGAGAGVATVLPSNGRAGSALVDAVADADAELNVASVLFHTT